MCAIKIDGFSRWRFSVRALLYHGDVTASENGIRVTCVTSNEWAKPLYSLSPCYTVDICLLNSKRWPFSSSWTYEEIWSYLVDIVDVSKARAIKYALYDHDNTYCMWMNHNKIYVINQTRCSSHECRSEGVGFHLNF